MNIEIWQKILDALPGFGEARGSMLASVESYLTFPCFTEYIPIEKVALIWQKARIMDMIILRNMMGVSSSTATKANDVAALKRLCEEAIQDARIVIDGVNDCSDVFKPL